MGRQHIYTLTKTWWPPFPCNSEFYAIEIIRQILLGVKHIVNPEIFGVKIFSDTSKYLKIKKSKIFQWYILVAKKERTQSGYPSWKMFNNNSLFYGGNWISIHHVSRLPLAPYWCPQMHDSLRSSSMIFHVIASSSNLFPHLEFIGVFNFRIGARIRKYFYPKIFLPENSLHKNFWTRKFSDLLCLLFKPSKLQLWAFALIIK